MTSNRFRELKKIHIKIVRTIRRKEFLEDCKHFGIIPKFMKIKNKTLIKEYKKDVKRFEKNLLNKVIRRQFAIIKNLEKLKAELSQKIIIEEGNEILNEYSGKIERYGEEERERCIKRQNKKLRFWLRRRGGANLEDNKAVQMTPYVNMSNSTLSSHQESLLKMGPKYILEDKIDLKDAIPKIENALTNFPVLERNRIRGKMQEAIEKKLRIKNKNDEDIRALNELKNNKDLACVHSDKTGKIIILDRKDYIEKMENTLKEMKLELINKDPNKKIKEKVWKLLKEGEWPENEQPDYFYFNHAPNTPRTFGKIKDHKNPPTVRPIVNKKEGPAYCLEKYMTKIYKKFLPNNTTSLSSTEEFIKKLNNIEIKTNQKMISFDIINLYPSIDITEINQIILEEIERNYTGKIAETLKYTSNLIINENYLQFNGKIYRQKNGVPMGSPISGILAEMKIRKMEQLIEEKFKDKIKHWFRYVDDIFAILTKDTEEEKLLQELNLIDENIQFTMEKEEDNRINYLDVTIMNINQKLETTVYRKPNATQEIINAKCKTPYNYKIASLRSYINRAITICSNDTLLNEELRKIEKIAIQNGYNKQIIQNLYKKRIKTLNKIESRQKERKKYIAAIPYCKGAANVLKNEAFKYNINIPIKPDYNIYQHIKSDRDNINPLQTPGIYKIEYTDENNEKGYYIGLTKRKINERIKEHKSDIKYARQNTAIARLANKKEITINYENVKKIAEYNNKNYAFYREAIEITNNDKACNDMEHCVIDGKWRQLLTEERMRGGRRWKDEQSNEAKTDQEKTEEG